MKHHIDWRNSIVEKENIFETFAAIFWLKKKTVEYIIPTVFYLTKKF
jgi:hypothetical protein